MTFTHKFVWFVPTATARRLQRHVVPAWPLLKQAEMALESFAPTAQRTAFLSQKRSALFGRTPALPAACVETWSLIVAYDRKADMRLNEVR